jgi:hypothetical protein
MIQQVGSRKRAIFVLCPEQAKHLRAWHHQTTLGPGIFLEMKTRTALAMRVRSFLQFHFKP